MNVFFFETEALEAQYLLDLYGDIDYDTVREPLTAANAEKYQDAEVISTFIYSDLRAQTLSKLKRLRLIATRSRSYDHIDLDYCASRGICVVNVPSYGVTAVAEHAFALLLALNRKIPQACRHVRDGEFSLDGLQGVNLSGKTLGIIGAGAIGLQVAKIALGFGMTVLAHDIHPRMNVAKDVGFTYTGFDRLLSQSDVISLHVENTPSTRHLLADREFNLMKDGVVILNTSREAVIDIKALVQALVSGKVGGAGLDVLPEEPALREEAQILRADFQNKSDLEALVANHVLLRQKNAIVTPHIAFYTRETVVEILRATGDNIRMFFEGRPINVVLGSLPKAAGT
jgi:D-lactate dehydrogenase